jgi:multiple sugar transport system substrate-binding protein
MEEKKWYHNWKMRLVEGLTMENFLVLVFLTWILSGLLILKDDHDILTQKAAGKPTGDRIQIMFWHGMSGPLGKVMDDLIGRFNAHQTKYQVNGVCMGSYDTLQKKLLASLVAKSAPDISQNFESHTMKFAKHHKIVCLDTLIASESEDIKSDIIPVLLANNTFNGKLWSFPFNKSVPVLYYNKDLFRKAGLDPEKPPATLEDLREYSRRLTVKDPNGGKPKVIGFATGKGNVWMFLNRTLQFGGKMIDETTRQAYFADPGAIAAIKFVQDIIQEGIAKESQGFEHQNEFKAQTVAMIENSIVSKLHMESGAGLKFDFGVAPLPGAATSAAVLSGSNINIFDNGDHEKIKGAWEFIKWFTSTDIGAEWSIRTTYLPVRKSSLRSEVLLQALEKDPNLKAPYIQLDYIYFEPRLSSWFEIRDLIADYLERATLEMGPPEKYLIPMNREIDGILKHARN